MMQPMAPANSTANPVETDCDTDVKKSFLTVSSSMVLNET